MTIYKSNSSFLTPGVYILMVIALCSCKKNFLGVSDVLAPESNLQTIFSDATQTRNFFNGVYEGMPNSSGQQIPPDYSAITSFDNPWVVQSDEGFGLFIAAYTDVVNGYNATNASYHRYGKAYQLIRTCNIFMDRAHPIAGTEGSSLDADEIKRMKTIARFFRAFYHYLLLEQYGPVPIIDKVIDNQSNDLIFPRNSVDEVVDFIDKELLATIADLPEAYAPEQQNSVSPVKVTAYAVRAKLWMYAASPLLNGGYTEALQVKNQDGKQLFPAADPSKWQKAKSALEDFFTAAGSRFELYKVYKSNGDYDPDQSLYRMFMDAGSKEIIWANPKTLNGDVNGSSQGTDRRKTPASEGNGWCAYGVTQEFVDAFLMKDGLPIDESPLYSESRLSVAGDDLSGRTEPGTFMMYVNREPRFYQSVLYHGRRYHISNNKVFFDRTSPNNNTRIDNPKFGYLLYKNLPRTTYNGGNSPRSLYRPSIIFRLAEFYLLYAEACNEVNPSDPGILTYINRVRQRAGIPNLEVSYPGILGNQTKLRTAIQRESQVELAAEGQRYFNTRRWMIAQNEPGKGGQGGVFHGMDMNSSDPGLGGFLKRVPVETRVFQKQMYLYPFPLNEVLLSNGVLVQNPGW